MTPPFASEKRAVDLSALILCLERLDKLGSEIEKRDIANFTGGVAFLNRVIRLQDPARNWLTRRTSAS